MSEAINLPAYLVRLLHLSRWSLRSKLVVSTMALLTGICFVVGLVCYVTMAVVLNNQLNASVTDASNRITAALRENQGYETLPNLPIGTISARVVDGELVGKIIFAKDHYNNYSPSGEDVKVLVSIEPTVSTINRKLTKGDYRFVAVRVEDGVQVTGIPRKVPQDTLRALSLTIISVSLTGLVAIGLIATVTIRRAMTPLNQLANVATRVSHLPLEEGEVKLAERAPSAAANIYTEVGTVGLALNKMLDNVASALQSRQRSETKVRHFVADASHELRTPLTAIRGYAEMIRATETLSPVGEQSLERVEMQAKRMGAMVEDLLTLARLDEGKPLELVDLELTHLVVEVVNDMKVAVPDHTWVLDIPSTPFFIRADATGVRQILMNLLSNAAKHTEPGTVVRTGLQQTDRATVVLSVIDNGPGIPEQFQPRIFDRFTQADAARSGQTGTTGLGLSIVQAIAQAHGGHVALHSQPGHTQFVVELPHHHKTMQ